MSRIRRTIGCVIRPLRARLSEQSGVTLVLTSAALVVLLGMAALSVDMGWLYLQTSQTRKAAESAALAGVVHMPFPTSGTFDTSEAYTTALSMAASSGYSTGGATKVVPLEVPGRPNELEVEITTSTNTFFMRLFGVRQVTFTQDATAQQLPPLKLGSDEPFLGTDPGVSDEYFWVAINGECRKKEDGDPFSVNNLGANCSGSSNTQLRDPTYFYAVDVPSSNVGDSLTVSIYDGPVNGGGLPGDSGAGGNDTTTFELLAPDSTPSDPFDNTTVLCTLPFGPGAAGGDTWTPFPCTPNAVRGIYVVRVSISGNDNAINAFSIKSQTPGANFTSVYGLTAMSLWMQDAGEEAEFKIVKLEEFYAGNEMIIGLFDPGDVSGGSADLTIKGEMENFECQVRVLAEDGQTVLSSWGSDDSPGSAPCELDTSGKRFNNQWLEFKFDVPNSYTCSGGSDSCWVMVEYEFEDDASVTERTTWTARINGQPIHLLP